MAEKHKVPKKPKRKKRKTPSVDPTKMRVLPGGRAGPPGGPPGAPVQESREARTLKMLALRNLAREFEGKPLYFLPVDTNPLAVMGLLQATPAEEGLNQQTNIPWSVLETFLPLPLLDVPGRTGMYYLVEVVGRTAERVTLTFTRKDIIDESKIPKPPPQKAPEVPEEPKEKKE